MIRKTITSAILLVAVLAVVGCKAQTHITTQKFPKDARPQFLRGWRGLIVLKTGDDYFLVKSNCCIEGLMMDESLLKDLHLVVMPPDKLELAKKCRDSDLMGRNIFDVFDSLGLPRYCSWYDCRCDGRIFLIPEELADQIDFSMCQFAVAKFIYTEDGTNGRAVYIDSNGTVVWECPEEYGVFGNYWR